LPKTTTTNGRIVRDGRGISPDIESKNDSIKGLMYHLLEEYKIFDFAVNYVKNNPNAVPLESFALTDADYEAFKQEVLNSSFKFNSYSLDILKKLTDMAKLEECYENNKTLFDSLQTSLSQRNAAALDSIRPQIMQYLTAEIAKNYYYQWGEMYHVVKHDKVIEQALQLFTDPKRYDSILAKPKK
jgi:carboxyl-terminal processing protease